MATTAARCCAPITSAPLTQADAEALAPLLKAVADPVRLRLLSMIASARDGEICVCDLAAAFKLTAPTISHHLKVLRTVGLIDSERRGTWVYYSVLPDALARLGVLFTPLAEPAAP
jgi:ArsR family transcriptional regulator